METANVPAFHEEGGTAARGGQQEAAQGRPGQAVAGGTDELLDGVGLCQLLG